MQILKASLARKSTNATPAVSRDLSAAEIARVSGGNIGSQSSGAGAGKITFNPFSITRKIDR